jgi:hypothetical protein
MGSERKLLIRALDVLEEARLTDCPDWELGDDIRAELAKPDDSLRAFHDFFADRGESLFFHFGQEAIDLFNSASIVRSED